MHGLRLLIIAIGAFLAPLAYAEAEKIDGEGYPPPGVVYVEPTDVVQSRTKDGEPRLMSYLERRGRWGAEVGVGYSSFEPINYMPRQAGVVASGEEPVFGDVFKTPEVPLLEFQVNVKRNLPIGSLGVEVGVGYYKNDADYDDAAVTLTLTPVRVGATFSLDNLYKEPYVVPYVSLGGYVVSYQEEGLEDTTSGTTKVASYFNLGAQFSLDWLDRRAARDGYLGSGLQATFAFLEARKLMASSNADDPDLSNSVSYGGGVRVEF